MSSCCSKQAVPPWEFRREKKSASALMGHKRQGGGHIVRLLGLDRGLWPDQVAGCMMVVIMASFPTRPGAFLRTLQPNH